MCCFHWKKMDVCICLSPSTTSNLFFCFDWQGSICFSVLCSVRCLHLAVRCAYLSDPSVRANRPGCSPLPYSDSLHRTSARSVFLQCLSWTLTPAPDLYLDDFMYVGHTIGCLHNVSNNILIKGLAFGKAFKNDKDSADCVLPLKLTKM